MPINIDYDKDIVYEINVDLHSKTHLSTVYSKQYDENARYIVATVWDDGEPYVIPNGTTIMFRTTKPDGSGIANMCEVINGKIVYQITLQTTIVAGEFNAEFGLYNTLNGEAKAYSSPTFRMYIEESALADDTILSTSEVNVLTELITDATEAIAQMGDISGTEATRVSNENIRKTNETNRVSAESGRVTSENVRVTTENTRKTNEDTRVTNETTRQTNETGRVSAESNRVTNETTRGNQETIRQSNEATRQTNETTRQNYYNAYKVHEPYSPSKPYVIGNKVTYQGGTYLCKVNTTGNAPTYNSDNTWWICLAAKGQDGIGVGDMLKSQYDVNNKQVDFYDYADNKIDVLSNDVNTNKLDKTGESSNTTVKFTESATETDIVSNEKSSTLFGKIVKSIKTFRSAIGVLSSLATVNKSDLVSAINELNESKFSKNNIVNNDAVTEEGFAWDARRGKAIRDDLNTVNNNLTTVTTVANDSVLQTNTTNFHNATTQYTRVKNDVVNIVINFQLKSSLTAFVAYDFGTVPDSVKPLSNRYSLVGGVDGKMGVFRITSAGLLTFYPYSNFAASEWFAGTVQYLK